MTLPKPETYTVPMLRRASLVLTFLVVACLAAASGTAQAQPRSHALYASALDQSGAPVQSLAPTDVVVREDKIQREVLSILPASDPMEIVLLVDNSQASDPTIRDLREGLLAFLKEIGADESGVKHSVALITVGERPTIATDYTTDLARVEKSAGSIFSQPGSGTYLLEGIIESTKGIIKRKTTRPVMLAITTEGPELSDRYYETVLDPLKESGAMFNVLIVGRPLNNDQDRSIVLDRGTKDSGGRYDTVLTSNALPMRLKQIAADLTHQWKVTYSRPESLIQPESVSITSAKPGLTVRGTAVKEVREPR